MAINVSAFHPTNIADTCAVWNVLSSKRLFRAALDAGVVFVVTRVVIYECMFKPRKTIAAAERELRGRLDAAQRTSAIVVHPLDIEDLQTIQVLESRKRLGKGELSCIAFAMKTRQAVLTDDQKARKLTHDVHPCPGAQTTPHLLGWLFYGNRLMDSEKDQIVCEHREMGRPLAGPFEDIYIEALRCRLMAATTQT